MPTARHSETVVASVQTIWDLLLDTIDHPGNYLPDVDASAILVRGTGFVIRRMTAGGLERTERITADQGARRVVFSLVDHPLYDGRVEHTITTSLEGGYPTLTFTLDWARRDGKPDELDRQAAVAAALRRIKKLAEAAQEA